MLGNTEGQQVFLGILTEEYKRYVALLERQAAQAAAYDRIVAILEDGAVGSKLAAIERIIEETDNG